MTFEVRLQVAAFFGPVELLGLAVPCPLFHGDSHLPQLTEILHAVADSLVVIRIQRQHPIEHALGSGWLAQPQFFRCQRFQVLRRFQDCQFQTQLPVYLLEPHFFCLQLTQVITDLGPFKVGPYKTDAASHKDEQHENDQKK